MCFSFFRLGNVNMGRSSSLKTGSLFLRKHRKWPHSPFKARWHQTFNQQLAVRNLKQAAIAPPPSPQDHQQTSNEPHLLSALIHSFSIYFCEPTPQAYHFLIKTLTKSALLHQIPPVLDHLEKAENFETPEFIFAHLIKIYGNANEIQNAVHLFYRIPRFRCVPSMYSLNALLSVLCATSEGLKLVPQVLLKSRVMNIRIDESSFRFLIDALCRIKKVGYAVKMFNWMMTDGFNVDANICSSLFSSLCEQADISSVNEVMGFLSELRKWGFCPGIVDYTNVIRFLVRRGMGMDALDVLNQMKSDGIKPDIVCYTMVLKGVISNGFYAKADEVFDELLVFGLVPDIYTYNVFIEGLCKQSNVEAGIKMVACMEELGCKPNLVTYNTLLKAFYESGAITKAWDLVKDMDSKGIELGVQTYKIMINGLITNGNIIEAYALFEEVLDKGLRPLTFDGMICGLCQMGAIGEALELLQKMVHNNIFPGVRAWEALLLCFRSSMNFAEDTLIGLVDQKTNLSTS